MSGCTNCKGKSGCDDRKGSMFEALDETLARLYPTQTWGELDLAACAPALADDDLHGLARDLAGELDAQVIVRRGDDDEPCDYLYVLAMGRPPCALAVTDGGAPTPPEWARAPGPLHELYLRIAVSHLAPMAAVQQVAVEITPTHDATGAVDGFAVHERPRAGVYDAPLLPRLQRLVAVLPAYGLTHLDFGEISAARPGWRAGAWRDAYAGEPAVANYLFSPRPTTMPTSAWRPA